MSAAARGTPRVALVTCQKFPDLESDDQLLLEPLRARQVAVDAVVWDDPAADWSRYDLVVLRSTWDYVPRRDAFVRWLRTVPALANPAGVVAWNTDKRYLAALAGAGVPVVPTTWLDPGAPPWVAPAAGEYVIKPAISASSADTGRYDLADPEHRRLAGAHAARLREAGRVAMVQPYLSAVDTDGETALVYLGGAFSHAVRKGAQLDGPDEGLNGVYKPDTISAREPSPAQLALADRALAAVPGVSDLLYARVDLIPGPDGAPLLIELELAEPSLFLRYGPQAPTRLAESIVARLRSR